VGGVGISPANSQPPPRPVSCTMSPANRIQHFAKPRRLWLCGTGCGARCAVVINRGLLGVGGFHSLRPHWGESQCEGGGAVGVRANRCFAAIKPRVFYEMAVVVRGGAKSGLVWGAIVTHSALGEIAPVPARGEAGCDWNQYRQGVVISY
jgi:hypothetical protein